MNFHQYNHKQQQDKENKEAELEFLYGFQIKRRRQQNKYAADQQNGQILFKSPKRAR